MIAPSLEIVGGQSVQASRLIENLGRETTLDVEFLPIDQPLPLWIRSLKYVRTAMNFCVFIPMMIRNALRTDVIHVFTASYSSYLLWTVPVILAGRLFRTRVIVNYHDGRAEGHLRTSHTARWTLRLADAIVTPSDYLVDVFAKAGLKAISIFNIVDGSRFRFRNRWPLRPRFMTNRGLEPLYNVSCVIRAFGLIQKQLPDASLTIAHDGPCRAELEAQVRRQGLCNVQFVGRIPQEQIAALYDDADIYLMSPNIDNMPLSVLECYASGLPLVSTAAGGVPYIVKNGETGLLVERDDAEAMAACALRLIREPELTRKIVANGRRESERYAWPALREQWVNLYHGLRVSGVPRTYQDRS